MRKACAVVLFMFFVGCAYYCKRVYYPGFYYSGPPEPVPVDVKGNLISGSFHSRGDIQNCDAVESNSNINLTYSNFQSGSYWSGSYNLFSYFGTYEVADVGAKSYYGFGGHLGLNLFLPLSSPKLGLGVNGGVTVEAGPYEKFRDKGIGFSGVFLISSFAQFNLTRKGRFILRLATGFPGLVSLSLGYYTGRFGLWLGKFYGKSSFSAGVFAKIGK